MGERMSLFIAQTERLKTWIGLAALVLTNVVSLGAGISAHYKTDPETTAHATYKELASAVEAISKENIKLSNDLANLRGYVSGMNNKQLEPIASIGSGAGTGAGYGMAGGARRISRSVASVPSAHPTIPQTPPPMTAAPKQYHPPTIEALTK